MAFLVRRRGSKEVNGRAELKEFRAKVILKHSKVIGKFVDTSDPSLGVSSEGTIRGGRLCLGRLIGRGGSEGVCALGFSWLDERNPELVARATTRMIPRFRGNLQFCTEIVENELVVGKAKR